MQNRGGNGAWAFVKVVHTIASQTVTCTSVCNVRKMQTDPYLERGLRIFHFLKKAAVDSSAVVSAEIPDWLSRQGSGTNYLVWLIAWIGKMAVCVYMCTHNKFCVKYVYKIFPPDFLIKVYNREESFSKRK